MNKNKIFKKYRKIITQIYKQINIKNKHITLKKNKCKIKI